MVIYKDFKKKNTYSADIYSLDLHKSQLNMSASSPTEAFHQAYGYVNENGTPLLHRDNLRCIAVFEGTIDTRQPSDLPVATFQHTAHFASNFINEA